MLRGVCAQPDKAALAKAAGYDYIESNCALIGKMTEEEFDEALVQLRAADIPCLTMNCLLPGAEYMLVGPDADHDGALRFVENAFARAKRLGVEKIVFGSGGARRRPEGFPEEEAWRQLTAFAQKLAKLADAYGITVCVEPLNAAETNMVITLAEGAKLARAGGLKLLADMYHVVREPQEARNMETLAANADILSHVHVAHPQTRAYPAPDDDLTLYAPFFAALKKAGYDGTVSLEGIPKDMAADAAPALETIKKMG